MFVKKLTFLVLGLIKNILLKKLQSLKNMKTSRIIIYALLISFFGCQSEPHSPTTSPYKLSESFIDKLNEQAGCCFRTVKINTYQGEGWLVLRNQEGWYRAINLDDYDKNQGSEWEFFQANQIKVVPSNRYHGSFSDIYGNIYEEDSSYPKDLEKEGYFIEKINIKHISYTLSENFALSEKRSFEISKLIYHWEKIRNKRALNTKDFEQLSQSLLGLSYIELLNGMKKIEDGQFDRINKLIEKASVKNGIRPEDLKIILGGILVK